MLQDRVIKRGELIKVVGVLLGSRRPRKVHIAHFRWDRGQVVVDIRILQMRRHLSIVDRIDLDRVTAKQLYCNDSKTITIASCEFQVLFSNLDPY